MPNVNTTEDDGPELNQYARTSIRQSLKSFNIGLNDGWENAIRVHDAESRTDDDGSRVDEFEVLVDIAGRLDLIEVMENQGLLIYCRDGVEIKVRGFQNESVLLDVIHSHDTDE